MLKHIFFDVDGTLTPSKRPATPDMITALSYLAEKGYDLVAVSGASVGQMMRQLHYFSPIYWLGQNGNQAAGFWNDELGNPAEIMAHISLLLHKFGPAEYGAYPDLIENRGCQISLSLIGHNKPPQEKQAYDPDHKKRRAMLKMFPFKSKDFEVKIAGTTTLDYFRKGRHKGYNITRLLKELNWLSSDCIYVGDSLGPGGNDETVVGVIPTHKVGGPADTFDFIKTL